MVVLSKLEHFPYNLRNYNANNNYNNIIPLIDLSKPDSKHLIVQACEDFGFFKVINHGVPIDFIQKLESEALNFFSLPHSEKQKAGPPNPFGYGNRQIGGRGDMGLVEYLLFTTNPEFIAERCSSVFGNNSDNLRCTLNDYISAVRKLTCEILELMAEGLMIQPRDVLSKMLMDDKSDSALRLNHYPPCSRVMIDNNDSNNDNNNNNVIGFGEHTDPQIISVLRSNNTSGLQILLRDGSWLSVPPDQDSFFINVGDSLQVMTNRRFHSVKHRVLANSLKSRVSMIYFGGPPLSEKIAPLPCLMEGEESLYKEFTWFEYKKSAYNTRLSENRLIHFEKIAAS